MEDRNRLRAVFGPQQDAIAGPDAALLEQGGKASGEPCQFPIGGYPPPVSLVADHSDLAVETAKVIEECSQMVSHGRSGAVQAGSICSMPNSAICSL